jgi:hypothetical protein
MWFADVKMTFDNAMTYNPVAHPVHRQARKLSAAFADAYVAILSKAEGRLRRFGSCEVPAPSPRKQVTPHALDPSLSSCPRTPSHTRPLAMRRLASFFLGWISLRVEFYFHALLSRTTSCVNISAGASHGLQSCESWCSGQVLDIVSRHPCQLLSYTRNLETARLVPSAVSRRFAFSTLPTFLSPFSSHLLLHSDWPCERFINTRRRRSVPGASRRRQPQNP